MPSNVYWSNSSWISLHCCECNYLVKQCKFWVFKQFEFSHSDIFGNRNKQYSLAVHLIQPLLCFFYLSSVILYIYTFIILQKLFSSLNKDTACLPKNTHSYTVTSGCRLVCCRVISYTEAEGGSGGWKWGFQPPSHLCSPISLCTQCPLVQSYLWNLNQHKQSKVDSQHHLFTCLGNPLCCYLWCNVLGTVETLGCPLKVETGHCRGQY